VIRTTLRVFRVNETLQTDVKEILATALLIAGNCGLLKG
jgi:hypothetical protein